MRSLVNQLRNRVYYTAKPFLPRRIRLAVRRCYARRLRKKNLHSWPILEAAGRQPEGWQGWPERKQFSLVLTHDVESAKGLAKVRLLAELEMSLGFRSCFNFVPEGCYQVPVELLEWLKQNGFEIGVHDHRHDGRLYTSRDCFSRSAVRINHFLEKWEAVGFRSGFMFRNLEWLHQLNIAYDCSTFDTDPFEPQPDGVGTIFPFWIPQNSNLDAESVSSGYVELPYTLTQDFTLFSILKERTIKIWQEKLDWVSKRGGMALVNVHPDYMQFQTSSLADDEYPADLYREFLQWVGRNSRARSFQIMLPREVAAHARAALVG